jgi:hypothetical protein
MRKFLWVFGAVLLATLFTSNVQADSLTYSISGTAPDGTAISGTFTFTASPDGLGDGGFPVSAITNGSLTLEGSNYTVTGLTPLDGDPAPLGVGDAYYMGPGYHYFSYDNILFPTASEPFDGSGLLFYAGLGQPADLYCLSGGTCKLGVWISQGSVLSGLFPNGGNNTVDPAYEDYTIKVTENSTPSVPEPSSVLLLGAGLGLLVLAGFTRRA